MALALDSTAWTGRSRNTTATAASAGGCAQTAAVRGLFVSRLRDYLQAPRSQLRAQRESLVRLAGSSSDPMRLVFEILREANDRQAPAALDAATDLLVRFPPELVDLFYSVSSQDSTVPDKLAYIVGLALGRVFPEAAPVMLLGAARPSLREAGVEVVADFEHDIAERLLGRVSATDPDPNIRERAADLLGQL